MPARLRTLLSAVVPVVIVATALVAQPSVSAWKRGEQVSLGVWGAPPAALSTSGDYATDELSNPWDFSDDADVIPIIGVGTSVADGVSVANGAVTVTTHNATEIRMLMKWPGVIPWGNDGWRRPIDADVYTQTTFRIYSDIELSMAIRFQNALGSWGVIPFVLPAGWSVQHFDLRDPSLYKFPNAAGPWAGPVVQFQLFRGGAMSGGDPPVNVQLDWVRVHRADAPQEPPTAVPVPVVLTPNVEGGADYATEVRGNPWDFEGTDDIGDTHQLAGLNVSGGAASFTTVGNDPFLEFPLGGDLVPDRYHRLTIDACYAGGFSLDDAAGGGMMGRVAWMPRGTGTWTETQDIIVFPGCRRMTIDMAVNPPAGLHDEGTQMVTGWRGIRLDALRFDPNEDRGSRAVSIRDVRLTDDAAFTTSYPITYTDAANVPGTVADIYVTTNEQRYDGTRIASGVPVQSGVNTFTWNGTDAQGAPMPNGTYWIYIVMRSGSRVGTGYATGPLRREAPQPATPSYFVPLSPARLLDTRTGVGGNISPLGQQVYTELDVTGVGGVPETGVTAVVMNVTVDGPTAPGYITAWPSGEDRPTVSNLNYVPGQTVPNLVTVKIGANGRVNILNSTGAANVIADVVGYYTPNRPQQGGLFTPLTPSRVLDTRSGVGRGGVAAAVPGGTSIDVPVTGVGGVPATGVTAVALNVTVDQPTSAGYLTTWPTGEPMPTASTHNFVPGLTAANLVLAKVGTGGQVSMFNSAGSTHLIADVVGYFSSQGGTFVPVTPSRLVDTRDGTGGVVGPIGQASSFSAVLAGGGVIPANATAVVVNVTSANSTAPSFVTAWPSGVGRPTASTMNPRPGVPVPNQAYLKLGPGGQLAVFNNSGNTDVVIDVFGYVL